MIADSRFRMTPDLRENNGWPICLIRRNPQAAFCPTMSKLVLELWMCYHLSFLCCVKQRYQILTKTPPCKRGSCCTGMRQRQRDRGRSSPCSLALCSLQREPSISAWSRSSSSEPRMARELLMGYGGFITVLLIWSWASWGETEGHYCLSAVGNRWGNLFCSPLHITNNISSSLSIWANV